MSTSYKSECPGGAGHIAEQNNHNINFPIFTHNSKDEKSVIAYFSIAGYSARPLRDGGVHRWQAFVPCKRLEGTPHHRCVSGIL